MVASIDKPTKMVGQALKRREDPRLMTGAGSFIDDIRLPGLLHTAMVRTDIALGRIRSIDTSAAVGMAGVVAVFTGKDFLDINPLPFAFPAGGVKNNANPPRILAVDEVHMSGEAVAVVVATDAYLAHDAARAVRVEYDALPAVVDAHKATLAGAPQLHENAPQNVAFEWSCGKDANAIIGAMADAELRISADIRNQRLIPTPLETRGSIGRYEPTTGEYTLWATSQAPHVHKLLLAAFVLGVPEQKVRVIAPDVGGGFGAKIFLYYDMPLVLAISKRLGGVPIKFVEDRSENYLTTTHGRDHVTHVDVGATRDGKITAMNVHTYANLGAYVSTIAGGVATTLYGRMVAGCYKIPNIRVEVKGVFTNTSMVDAYRGAGRPEAAFLIERVCDLVAGATGIDPADVRRRNFIQPGEFPYDTGIGMLPYDSGNYEPALDLALAQVGYRELRADQARRRAAGGRKQLGIGLSSYVEVCGIAPSKWIGAQGWGAALFESANVKVHLTGKVVVTTGSLPHGQGHETTFSQVVADELGVPYDDVEIQHSDTQGTPFGYGTYGSRSLAVGGTAIIKSAEKIREKARKIAAHMLEANPDDIVWEDGKFRVKGLPDRAKTMAEVALAASVAWDLPEGIEPFLDETTYYDPPACTFPFGTHICVVEVDTETGVTEVVRYLAVDDVGNVVNPLIVDGQLHGGIAQGLAQALYEGAHYSDDGQLLTGSMSDYAIPKASMVPVYELDRTVTPSPINPLGVKGAGEAGTIASTPAVANAVIDAVAHLGIAHIDMPLTPERVWRAIDDARA